VCIKNVLKGKHEHSECTTPIIKIGSTLNFDPVTIGVILLTTFPSKSDDFNLTVRKAILASNANKYCMQIRMRTFTWVGILVPHQLNIREQELIHKPA
jgi:hypothetical protein